MIPEHMKTNNEIVINYVGVTWIEIPWCQITYLLASIWHQAFHLRRRRVLNRSSSIVSGAADLRGGTERNAIPFRCTVHPSIHMVYGLVQSTNRLRRLSLPFRPSGTNAAAENTSNG